MSETGQVMGYSQVTADGQSAIVWWPGGTLDSSNLGGESEIVDDFNQHVQVFGWSENGADTQLLFVSAQIQPTLAVSDQYQAEIQAFPFAPVLDINEFSPAGHCQACNRHQ
jgi:hypothetical protein